MITKTGDAILQEHQRRVLDRLRDPDAKGLVAYHSMGSGKTLTALKALQEANERTGRRGLFIAPASLVDNAWKEVGKHGLPLSKDNLDVMSYERAANRADDLLKNDYGMVVFDEAHRLRNANTKRVSALKGLIPKADRTLMLTGTAGYNNPSDVGALVHLIDRKATIPDSPTEFEAKHIDLRTMSLKNRTPLQSAFHRYVDVYEKPQDTADFPAVTEEIVRTPMSERQAKLYRHLMDKLPPHLRKSVRDNMPLGMKDSMTLNTFAAGIRQASVSPMHHDVNASPEDSPKLVEAVRRMGEAAKAPGFRGVAYSNYLDAGINPYADLMRKRGIEPLVFTGALSAKEKKSLVDRFNADGDDPRVMLITSSGGEGLDLKGVRKMQILEPHWNSAKLDQVKARGARYRSHAHLPEDQRTMHVEEYHSILPKTLFQKLLGLKADGGIDVFMHESAERKKKIIEEMKKL